MPYTRDASGKWVTSDGPSGGAEGAGRLIIVDEQVDMDGTFRGALLKDVQVVNFNSETHTFKELVTKVRQAHRAFGQPFQSIAFANHGPAEDPAKKHPPSWKISKDCIFHVSGKNAEHIAMVLAPLVEVMVAILEKSAVAPSAAESAPGAPRPPHIAFLACKLAGFDPLLIPLLEKLYHVDFMGSDDKTGEAAVGGDWKMESDDGFDIDKVYANPVKIGKYRRTMFPCSYDDEPSDPPE